MILSRSVIKPGGFYAGVCGFDLEFRSRNDSFGQECRHCSSVVERTLGKGEVVSSNLTSGFPLKTGHPNESDIPAFGGVKKIVCRLRTVRQNKALRLLSLEKSRKWIAPAARNRLREAKNNRDSN